MAYEVEVFNDTNDFRNNTTYTGFDAWSTAGTSTIQWSATVYMYQLTCPKCNTMNWGQLNTEITCKGKLPNRIRGRKVVEQYCGATLKAVTKKADYEVEVG